MYCRGPFRSTGFKYRTRCKSVSSDWLPESENTTPACYTIHNVLLSFPPMLDKDLAPLNTRDLITIFFCSPRSIKAYRSADLSNFKYFWSIQLLFEWLGSVFMLRALRLCCKTQRVVRRARLVGWETIKSLLWHGDSRYDVIWLVINQQTTAQVLTPKYSIICCWIDLCFYNKPISVLVLKINLSWSQHAISRNPPPTNLLRIWEICRHWGNNESIFFSIPHHRFFRTFV